MRGLTKGHSRLRGVHATWLSLLLILVTVLIPVGSAHAADGGQEVTDLPPGLEVTEHARGHVEVRIDRETVIVQVDRGTNVATVTEPDGTRTVVDMGAIPSDTERPQLEITPSSSASCSFLLWVVGLVHSTTWIAAIGMVAATGAVGAAVVITMYALGANGFLFYVASHC